MSKELTEILCRILDIDEDEFLNSYLNDEKGIQFDKKVKPEYSLYVI